MSPLYMIADELEIPFIPHDRKVWFLRTKGGKYYFDFKYNGFIALGWDRLSPGSLFGAGLGREAQKAYVENAYPDEKRHGLILGQMDVFYNRIQAGDMVIIPNEGSKAICIGVIGDLISEVRRQPGEEEYPQCSFRHRRSVAWSKEVYDWQDIYLFRTLRGQQTISDVTAYANLVFRNLYPVYIFGQGLHLTLQKPSADDLALVSNLELLANIAQIADSTAALYGKERFSSRISVKTAVGSPGFLEMIFPLIPAASISAGVIVYIIKMAIGKATSPDGTVSTGLLAFTDKINGLLNSRAERQKTRAETEKIKAETEKLHAETEKLKAETELVQAQAAREKLAVRQLEREMEQVAWLPSGKTSEEQKAEDEQLAVPSRSSVEGYINAVAANGERICAAAREAGLAYDGEAITRAG